MIARREYGHDVTSREEQRYGQYPAAKRFAEEGAKVTIADLNGDGAAQAAAQLGGDAMGLALDVRDGDSWAAVMAEPTSS